MKTTTKNTGIKVTTGVKAGGFGPNQWRQSQPHALKIKTGIKAGGIQLANHNRNARKISRHQSYGRSG